MPWLIALAMLALLLGVGMIGRLALYFASPDIFRYPADLVASGGADYSFWALGPLIPPINPEAIEAAEAEENQPPQPPGPPGNVPIAVVGVPTAGPDLPVIPTPTATETPTPTPTVTGTTPPPPPTQTPPATATRTLVVERAPTLLPTSSRQSTSTPAAATSTPVSAPDTLPTRTPLPTQTPPPSSTRTATTAPPVQSPVQTTPPAQTPATPSPTRTATPVPPPAVGFVSGSAIVSEQAPNQQVNLEVRLSAPASQPVTVSYATRDRTARAGEDYTAANGTLTFAANVTAQTIAVRVAADGRDERTETFEVVLSGPANATLGELSTVTVTITDSDAPPTVSFVGLRRSVAEVGTVAATIQLNTPSTLDVVVPYTVGGTTAADDHGLRSGTVIIPAGASSARLRFEIVDDSVDEEDERLEIRLGTPSNAQLGPPSVYELTILDDDTAGVEIPLAALAVAEDPADPSRTTTYEVVLQSRPVAAVRIVVASADGQLVVAPADLTFTPTNWNRSQTVTVAAVDDSVDEVSPHNGRLTHTVTSADPRYNNFPADPITARITDNDIAGVLVAPGELRVTEAPGSGNSTDYSVRLNSQPVAPVQIRLAFDGEVELSPSSLTFNAVNWNQPVVVTVSASDDFVDEDGDNNQTPHTSLISHTATSVDANYNLLSVDSVTVTIVDNDNAGFEITPRNLVIGESGLNSSATYSVRLTSRPLASVRVTLSADDRLNLSDSSLPFTAENWSTPQLISVTAVDNRIDAPNARVTIAHSAGSADAIYNQLVPPPVAVTITDDDTAGIVIDPTSVSLTEASGPSRAQSYTVRLTSQPTATVTLAVLNDSEVTVSPRRLLFTGENWGEPQEFTVTAVEDVVDEDGNNNLTAHLSTIRHGVTSEDPNYDDSGNRPDRENVTVRITDNDTAAIRLEPANFTVAESGTLSYTVRLGSQPRAGNSVTLSLAPAPVNLLSLGTSTLTFTGLNWDQPQTVVVTAADNFVDAPDTVVTVAHSAASGDAIYNSLQSTATITVTDDDAAGFEVLPVAMSLSEDPAAPNHVGSYTVRLTSQPTATVTVALAPDEQLAVSAPDLLFDEANWNLPQTVTLRAIDDFVDEADSHIGVVSHNATSADQNYDGRAMPPITASIADDDTAGVIVEPQALSVSEGGVISYTVRLESRPTAEVTVAVVVTPTGLLTLDNPVLTFTPVSWSAPQTVTVSAAGNSVDAPDAVVTLAQVVTSADPNYDSYPVDPVVVTIPDDDTAAVLAGPLDLTVSELTGAADHSATYTVRLGSEPTEPVTITLDFDSAQLTTDPASLVFDAATWSISQTVTVTAVDNLVAEGTRNIEVVNNVASADPLYAALPSPFVTVAIVDDDQAGLDLLSPALALGESPVGTRPISGVLELQLRSRPTAPVTVALTLDVQLTADRAALVFEPSAWNVPQRVVLTAVDDQVDETAIHSGTLTFDLSSPDPFYAGREVAPFVVEIEDDDTAALVVSAPSGATTSESGGTTTFTVRLATRPLSPVSVAIGVDQPDEATVSSPPLPLEFSATSWDVPVTVTLTGQDDAEFDGLVPYTVTFALAGDPVYTGIPSASLPVLNLANLDDEPALASVSDPAPLSEGDNGIRVLRFPVTLRRPALVTVTLTYQTVDFGATPGNDFEASSGTLSFVPGDVNAFVGVRLYGDTDYEPDELVGLRLTSVSAVGDLTGIEDDQGVGVIRNDDSPSVRFAAADTLVSEDAGFATIAVRLDEVLTQTVRVNFTTVANGDLAGTAIFGEDYVGVSGTLVFPVGTVERTIILPIVNGDETSDERYETVRLSLFGANGIPLGSPNVASVTIVEDGVDSPLAGAPFLSTGGPAAATTDGYWDGGSGDGGVNVIQMIVPCGWPAGQPLEIELWSPAIHTDPAALDVALDPSLLAGAGLTTFALYDAGTLIDPNGQLLEVPPPARLQLGEYQPSALAEGWEPFFSLANPVPCGRYLLRSTASGDDRNQWAVRAPQASQVRFAPLLSTIEQLSPAGVRACTTTWFAVPPDAGELRLRTFDLDAGGGATPDPEALIAYYRPGEPFDPRARLDGQPGVASGDGVWGEDLFLLPAEGWWRAVLCTSGRNNFIFQALTDGVPLPVLHDPPPPVPALLVSLEAVPEASPPGTPITVTANVAVAGGATVRSSIFTIVVGSELSLVGDPCGAASNCSVTGNTIVHSEGDLPPGLVGAGIFTVTPNGGTEGRKAAVSLTVHYRDELGFTMRSRSSLLIAVE